MTMRGTGRLKLVLRHWPANGLRAPAERVGAHATRGREERGVLLPVLVVRENDCALKEEHEADEERGPVEEGGRGMEIVYFPRAVSPIHTV